MVVDYLGGEIVDSRPVSGVSRAVVAVDDTLQKPYENAKREGVTFTVAQARWIRHHISNALCALGLETASHIRAAVERCVATIDAASQLAREAEAKMCIGCRRVTELVDGPFCAECSDTPGVQR